jgi:hypothetical protein
MSGDEDEEPNAERVQRRAQERQHDRSQSIEEMVDSIGKMMGEQNYPVTAEELSVEYADETLDLPNETESLGFVFDRLVGERFESPDELREAVTNELTGSGGARAEYNDERALSEFDDDR